MEKTSTDVPRDACVDSPFGGSARQPTQAETPAALPPVAGSALAELVAKHIVPRMVLAHRIDAPESPRREVKVEAPTPEDVALLADVAVQMDTARVLELVESRLRSGLSYESALLDYIGGAARLLGDGWLHDERTFADVTLGLATLHRTVAMLRHRLKPPVAARGLAVLLNAPGEQHSLAIHVLGDLLTRAGWNAHVRSQFDEEELVAMVATEPVVMVGISVSSPAFLNPVGRIATRVKRSSINRDILVLLGGSLDLTNYARDVGAVYCSTALGALELLDRDGRVCLCP